MLEINIEFILNDPATMKEIKEEAVGRVDEQTKDLEQGNTNASYSYGKKGVPRSRKRRIEDAFIGCLAEYIICWVLGIKWEKRRRQYDGINKHDLDVEFGGYTTAAEVRGTRGDAAPFRCYRIGVGKDFEEDPNILLFVVTNLPYSPNVMVGYSTFGELQELCLENPSWFVDNGKGHPYFKVPKRCFRFNVNDFKRS